MKRRPSRSPGRSSEVVGIDWKDFNPPPIPPPSRPPMATAQERRLTYNGANQFEPIIFGEVHDVGGVLVEWEGLSNGSLVVRYLASIGPIHSIFNIRVGDVPLVDLVGADVASWDFNTPWPFTSGHQVYLGTSNQNLSKIMSLTTDWIPTRYPGRAHIVVQYPPYISDLGDIDILNLKFDAKGMLIRDFAADPVLVNRFFSEDAALIIADLASSTRYGGRVLDEKLNWDEIAAETSPYVMQDLGGGIKRYPVGFVIRHQQELNQLIQNIAEHAQIYIPYNSGKYHILADKPRPSSGLYINDDHIVGPAKVYSKGSGEVYDSLEVSYTDSEHGWVEKVVPIEVSGIHNTNEPLDVTSKSLLGTRQFQQAVRIGNYHLLKGLLDLRFTVPVNEVGAKFLPGDRFLLTSSSLNVENLDVVCYDVIINSDGYVLVVDPYDDDIYSNNIASEIGTVRPANPSPNDIPSAPTGLSLVEVIEGQDSRVKISFTPASVGFTGQFTRILVRRKVGSGAWEPWYKLNDTAASVDYILNTNGNETYEVELRTVTDYNKQSTAIIGSILTAGVDLTGPQGPAGANAKTIIVISDRQNITYDETGAVNPSAQLTTFTVNKQNTTAIVNWSATRADGTAISPVTNLLSSATGDSVTMTAANFNTQRGTTEGVIVTATVTDGTTFSDKISVVKVQKGATGNTGATGANAKTLIVISDRQNISYDQDGNLSPAAQTITFTTQKQNTTAVVSWTLSRIDGTVLDPTLYLSATTGDSVQMTAANFNTARGTTEGVIVTASLTDGSVITDKISVVKVQKGATGASVFTLVTQGVGAAIFTPSSIGKTSGGSAFDSGVYSLEGYARGVSLSFKPDQVTASFMVGLNTDPTLNSDYTSIDYAWYIDGGGGSLTKIYESGVEIGSFGAYTSSTVFGITYDGVNVRYFKDGVLQRTVARSIGNPLHLDSSFYSTKSTSIVSSLAFGPMGEQGTHGPATFTILSQGTGPRIFTPNSVGKISGSVAYDCGFYSAEGYVRGAFLSFRAGVTNTSKIVGLNADPSTSANYLNIDYGWYLESTGVLAIFESGTNVQSVGTHTTSTILAITYDGVNIRYFKDGVLQRTTPRAIGSALFFDSSFAEVSTVAQIVDIAFGPMGEQGAPASAVLANPNSAAGVGGRLLICPTTKLTSDLTTSATTISVESNVLNNGDRIVLQKVVGATQQTEYMAITSAASGTGPYTYTVTRNLDGSGADTWKVDDPIFNLGQTNSFFVDIYSASGLKASTEVGPTIVGNIRNSATFNDWTPRWAIGNLNGLYGYSSNIFGAAFGVPTGAWLKIDSTNGIRIGHNTTTKISIDASGNASFTGAITANSGKIGGWNLDSEGLWIASGGLAYIAVGPPYTYANASFYVDGTGKFSLSSRLTWDGSTLTLGGFNITSTQITTSAITIDANAGTISTNGSIGASGTGFNAFFGGVYKVNNVQVVGAQGSAVANATNTTDVITQFNTLLSRLRAHGLIAT